MEQKNLNYFVKWHKNSQHQNWVSNKISKIKPCKEMYKYIYCLWCRYQFMILTVSLLTLTKYTAYNNNFTHSSPIVELVSAWSLTSITDNNIQQNFKAAWLLFLHIHAIELNYSPLIDSWLFLVLWKVWLNINMSIGCNHVNERHFYWCR